MRPTIENLSKIHSAIPASMIKPLENYKLKSDRDVANLKDIGIILDPAVVKQMAAMDAMQGHHSVAMDALQLPNTTPSVVTPVQFLQNWLPGEVYELTSARLIDEFIGIMTVGAWEDEQIVQKLLELDSLAVPYGDYQNVPLSSWNLNYEFITNIRFQTGIRVGVLEAARAAKVNISADNVSRQSATISLEVARNNVGWYGYNSGNNFTYGFLNTPGLPSYVTASTKAAGGTTWAAGTFLEIQQDILNMIVLIRNQSQENIDPGRTPMVLGLATLARDQLAKTSDFGISVMKWLNDSYPNIRVVSAPQLNAANASANVGYLYAETTSERDMSTDGKAVFIQCVPAKFRALGVKVDSTYYVESYSNATAGVMCKRPYAVTRITGI